MSYQTKLLKCVETLLKENLNDLGINDAGDIEGEDEFDDITETQDHLDSDEGKEIDFDLESKKDIKRFLGILKSLLQ